MPSSAAQLSMHHSSNSVKNPALVRRFTLAVVYVGTMQPARHSRRAAGAASLSMFLKTALTLTAVLAACQEGAATTNCKAGKCITIGSDSYCSDCAFTDEVPIGGVCKAADATCPQKAAGRCTTCAQQSFMFKGGCYTTAKAPGSTMCTQAANGICTSVAAGNSYFVPPGADASHDSVVACNDTTEITLTDGKKYKGVANCLTCTKPTDGNADTPTAAKCTKCENGYFVENAACTKCDESCLTCEGAGADKCKSCTPETHFLGATGDGPGKCVSCGDASGETWKGVDGCLKCRKSTSESTPATCTECQAERYFKDGSPASCVTAAACNTGYFPNDNADGKKKCLPCSDNNNGGITNCAECSLLPSASRSSTVLVTCTKCGSDKYLKADGSGCVESSGCTPSTEFAKKDSEKGNRCVPCGDATSGVPNCAKCSPPTTAGQKPVCSECTSSYKLEGEACVPAGTNLSTGAIAGISVAAVVVVGGLVGFLCWWFICRGKA